MKKVKNIKRSWFGSWKEDSNGNELLDFHLTDEGSIVYRFKECNFLGAAALEKTNESSIEGFEFRFDISISDLLNN